MGENEEGGEGVGVVETKDLSDVGGAGIAKPVEGQAQIPDGSVVAQGLGKLPRSLWV